MIKNINDVHILRIPIIFFFNPKKHPWYYLL
jgi:hypothetical protein